MAITINQVNLGGNLTRDIEIKQTQSDTTVATCGIAVSERKKSGSEWVEQPIFMDVTIFGKLADRCAQYLKKGDTVFITGRLSQDTWNDKDTGAKRTKINLIAQDVVFIKWGKDRVAKTPDQAPEEAPF